jgi:hypothetical protein
LVTEPIGTSSSGTPGHSVFHILRLTMPCNWLTPFEEAAMRSASTVMQNSSALLAGFCRPSP